MEYPAPMVPGEVVEVSFALAQMGYRLGAGHRLRLALSNSHWPFVWPSPEAGVLTVTGGRLDLPVCQGAGVPWVQPAAEGAPAWQHKVWRVGQTVRRIETDLLSGRHVLIIEDDGGDVENLQHGLCTSEILRERWETVADDPLAARAVQVWEQRLWRAGRSGH